MGLARDHDDAVVALLAAHPLVNVISDQGGTPAATGLNVYTGDVPPNAPEIYAQFGTFTPQGEGARLSAHRPVSGVRAYLVYVAKTRRGVLWAADIGHDALDRQRPISSARDCTPLQGGGATVRKDTDINPGKWIATETWRFASTPKENP